VLEDAGIEPRTVATLSLALDALTIRLDLIHYYYIIYHKLYYKLIIYFTGPMLTRKEHDLQVAHLVMYMCRKNELFSSAP
jgi:hypothetical protein